MSWLFVMALLALAVAVVLIELRAFRAGDERQHHAPGYAMVMGGLVVIGLGIAAAVSGDAALTIVSCCAGLLLITVGVTRHREIAAH